MHRLNVSFFDIESVLLFRNYERNICDSAIRHMMYFVFVCFNAFNLCRHGKYISERLLVSIIKNGAQSSPEIRRQFRDLRRFGFGELYDG